jgi:hypothetical protein
MVGMLPSAAQPATTSAAAIKVKPRWFAFIDGCSSSE